MSNDLTKVSGPASRITAFKHIQRTKPAHSNEWAGSVNQRNSKIKERIARDVSPITRISVLLNLSI